MSWCLTHGEREGLRSFRCLESTDRRLQGCHVEVPAGGHCLGLVAGQVDQSELDLVDALGQVRGVDPGDPGPDGIGLLIGEQARSEDPLPRGPWLVVDALAASVGGRGVTGGLLGGGEEVQPQRDQRPQLAQQGELLGGVVPPRSSPVSRTAGPGPQRRGAEAATARG